MLSSWKWVSWPLARNFRPCLVAEANLAESVWQDSVSSSPLFAMVTTISRAHTNGRARIVGSSSKGKPIASQRGECYPPTNICLD
mmetsp:Transcript_8944/g.24939  ORF Transcript_8944/g.24939 Transcript_8944/m.24939 type:complete len:85 (+) Transcript_8944:1920-2174(+)